MGLRPGAKLGNYEIGALLGAGGTGEVYCARDLSLQREVAPEIPPALSHGQRTGKRQVRRAIAPAEGSGADFIFPMRGWTKNHMFTVGTVDSEVGTYWKDGNKFRVGNCIESGPPAGENTQAGCLR
jgi:serine/threonine protein kinase